MKVLTIYYIANLRFPTERAHGIQLAKMCEALLEEGVGLKLLVPRRNTAAVSPKDFYGLRLDIPIVRLPVIDVYEAGRLGFVLSSASYMFSYLLYILWKRLCGESFIVYTIDMDQFSFVPIPFLGVPYFCEIHDAKERTLPFLLLFKRTSGTIVINEIIRKALIERFRIKPDDIIVHPNGIDPASFEIKEDKNEARRLLSIPRGRNMLLYIGKLYPWKGMDVLVEAARKFPSAVHLYMVGVSNEELEADSAVGLPSNITCVGQRPYTEMPLWLRAADICLVLGTKQNPYSYYHTSPMKLFEYMAAECPIVASGTPAVNQIVSDKEAILYTPDSSDDLAAKISIALTSESASLERVKLARLKAETLTWDHRARSVLDFICSRL